ncbi:hypothetical protein HNR22_002251 [Micromonospora jinlongensis]|uniref:Uncharacterized protein n=1 Tax=Micromonospora jinlongensis TaxID=1287877 RepID=A0A7Z0BF09_9ACTN|nr:DUF6086 family protein [Micromonospora jinlongensis]NYH42524.1 hypothetical protein [Micromonospora jinlongensis]
MSYPFQTAETPVWDPALRVGQVYLGQAQSVAEVVGTASGLTPLRNGSCDLDPTTFTTFVDRLLQFYNEGRHPTLSQLLRGVLLVSLVLLERAGAPRPPAGSEVIDALLAEAAALEPTMPV